MKEKLPKFYPCAMQFPGDWCGGIATLVYQRKQSGTHRKVYVCSRCGSTWTEYGNPTTKRDEWQGTWNLQGEPTTK